MRTKLVFGVRIIDPDYVVQKKETIGYMSGKLDEDNMAIPCEGEVE